MNINRLMLISLFAFMISGCSSDHSKSEQVRDTIRNDMLSTDTGFDTNVQSDYGRHEVFGDTHINKDTETGKGDAEQCDSVPYPAGCTCTDDSQCVDNQCKNGKCQKSEKSGIGGPCKRNNQCDSGLCLSWLPDGYCSVRGCGGCPDGSKCIKLTLSGEDRTYCMKSCKQDGDCRLDYYCHQDVKVCWRKGQAVADIGEACDQDSDCKDGASCYPPVFGKEPTGFAEGYCILFKCKKGECPTGSVCMKVTSSGDTACVATCKADVDCRQGFFCDQGTCWPQCNGDRDCPEDYICGGKDTGCVPGTVYCSKSNIFGWCPKPLVCMEGECKEYHFQCNDHTFEPNNKVSEATKVEPGQYKQSLNKGLQICTNDHDWFELDIPKGMTGTLGLRFNNLLGDLDNCAYDGQSGKLVSCRYNFIDYSGSWRAYESNDEFVSLLSLQKTRKVFFKAYGYNGATNTYTLYAWLTPWKDGPLCSDLFPKWDCQGCKPDGSCTVGDFDSHLLQFPWPDPNDPYVGNGYVLEHSSSYNWLRREVIMAIRYAIHRVQQKFPDTKPLGLMDMCQINGITPGYDVGKPRHPETTHDQGGNIDVAYYQTGKDNMGRVICDPEGKDTDGYYCTSVAHHIVDLPRTAYFLAQLADNPRLRVIGVDKLIAPLLLDEIKKQYKAGDISDTAYKKLIGGAIAYGSGWPFHHHHMHISFFWWTTNRAKHRIDPPIGCGFRLPSDGSIAGYLNRLHK